MVELSGTVKFYLLPLAELLTVVHIGDECC